MTMPFTSLSRLVATVLACMQGIAMAADTATFEPATGTLRLPTLQLDAGERYRDVVVRLLDPGQLRVDDPAVGAELACPASSRECAAPALL